MRALDKIALHGTGKPMSDDAVEKLKKEIKAIDKQQKDDSKVDDKIRTMQFNV